MVEELDMSAEQTASARKLRETLQALILRRSIVVKCNGTFTDYDIVVNPEGKTLLPGMPGHLSHSDLEKVGNAILEMAEEARLKADLVEGE